MQKKLRHSKFKNTGILFELLTRQITADILSGKDKSEAKELLFKYFKENTELGKEWQLYNFLLNEKIKDEPHAERFFSVILEQRKKLNNKRLIEQKYSLIRELKELYPLDQFLKANIKNYRVLASIFKIFENSTSYAAKFDVQEVYQAKNCIVENIVDSPKKKVSNPEDDLISYYEKQSEDIRLISYKLLVEGLNKKYNDLDVEQKEILREFIRNVSNTNSLGDYINTKIDEIKIKLTESLNSVETNDVIRIKINEVMNQLDRIKPTNNVVKDNQIMVLLLSYELLNELKKVG